jgi:hypothetical protein
MSFKESASYEPEEEPMQYSGVLEYYKQYQVQCTRSSEYFSKSPLSSWRQLITLGFGLLFIEGFATGSRKLITGGHIAIQCTKCEAGARSTCRLYSHTTTLLASRERARVLLRVFRHAIIYIQLK